MCSLSNSSGLGASSIFFLWDATLWTTAYADLSYLNFASDGTLTDWTMGGNPSGITGESKLVFDDFILNAFSGGQMEFDYSTVYSVSQGVFEVPKYYNSWHVVPTAVPEPGVLPLVGSGLAALGLIKRRRVKR